MHDRPDSIDVPCRNLDPIIGLSRADSFYFLSVYVFVELGLIQFLFDFVLYILTRLRILQVRAYRIFDKYFLLFRLRLFFLFLLLQLAFGFRFEKLQNIGYLGTFFWFVSHFGFQIYYTVRLRCPVKTLTMLFKFGLYKPQPRLAFHLFQILYIQIMSRFKSIII